MAIYLFGTLFARLVTVALLPVYTRVLSPSEFGEYDLWANVCAFLAPVAYFQVWDALYRYYFTSTDRRALITNSAFVMGIGTLVFAPTAFIALELSNTANPLPIILYGSSIAAQYFFSFVARGEMRNGLFVVSGTINTALAAGISLLLLLTFDYGISSIFIGGAAGNILQSALIAYRLRSTLRFDLGELDSALVGQLLRFSLPLCFASVAYWMLSGFTRLAITFNLGGGANGLFAAADRFSFAVTTISSVIMYAWNELLYSSHSSHNAQRIRGIGTSTIIGLTLLGAALALLVIAPTFEFIVGNAYGHAYNLVPLTLLAATLNSTAGTLGSLFLSAQRTGPLLWTTAIAAVCNIVLAIGLIPIFGVPGAAISLFLAFLLLAAIRGVLVRRQMGIPFFGRRLMLSASTLGVAVGAYYAHAHIAITAVIAAIGCAQVYAWLMFAKSA